MIHGRRDTVEIVVRGETRVFVKARQIGRPGSVASVKVLRYLHRAKMRHYGKGYTADRMGGRPRRIMPMSN